MLIVCLEKEEWRVEALTENFLRSAGASVDIQVFSHMGELAERAESAHTLILPPKFETQLGCYEAADLQLLAWHLSRAHPDLEFVLFGDSDETDAVFHLPVNVDFDVEVLKQPSTEQDYEDWVAEFCKHRNISYQAPAPDRDWWSRRCWLVSSDSGELIDSHQIEDEELVNDLVSFFQLKSNQLLDCLQEDSWTSWILEGEGPPVEIRPGRRNSVVFTKIQAEGESIDLPESSCETLREMGLLKSEA